ncbi:MAG: hypothetical protein GX607_22750 [Myxococcales bacterium]|nr:hypothetical protein [Myxococcales bacterium]
MLRRVWLFVLGVSFLVGACVLSPVEDLPARGNTEPPGGPGADGNDGIDAPGGGPDGDLPADPGGLGGAGGAGPFAQGTAGERVR